MHDTSSDLESERSAASGRTEPVRERIRPCPVCGAPMTGRRTSACSDKCRASKSRQKHADQEDRLRGLVNVLAKEVGLTAEDLL